MKCQATTVFFETASSEKSVSGHTKILTFAPDFPSNIHDARPKTRLY